MSNQLRTEALVQMVVQARLGGKVERCHAIPHLGSYSNASHQWGVAILLYYLFPEHFARLVIYALTHDVPEAWAGDIPAPPLRYIPGLRESLQEIEGNLNKSIGLPPEHELNAEDLAILKACDRLDLYLWAMDQQLMGNQFANGCMQELERYVTETGMPTPALLFFEKLKKIHLLPRQAGVIKDLMESMNDTRTSAQG